MVLVIDPITGQKMRSWRGMVQPETLLEVQTIQIMYMCSVGLVLQTFFQYLCVEFEKVHKRPLAQ